MVDKEVAFELRKNASLGQLNSKTILEANLAPFIFFSYFFDKFNIGYTHSSYSFGLSIVQQLMASRKHRTRGHIKKLTKRGSALVRL